MHWSLAFVFLNLGSAWAKLVTTIIDDAFPGDTDSSITYFPSLDVWVVGSSTIHGRVSPDPSQAQDGTWHDTTDDTTPDHDGTNKTYFELAFKGTGIDIRCIIANNLNDLPPFTGTKADYSFFIDSIPQNQDYHHEASTTGDAFLYNTSVFSTNGLANAPHKLQLVLNGGPDVNGSVLLLFDYAIVTSEEDTVATLAPGTSLTSATGTSASTQTSQSTIALSSTLTGTATGTSQVSTGTAGTSQISAIAGATVATPNQVSSALPTSPSSSHKLDIGAILGALGGGLLGLVLLFFAFLWIRRKRYISPTSLTPSSYPSFH
ncbi:hypothetical protein C8J56DRAFT_1061761 [Mycena floridula]|nr:hypothetical protein C8J56DRAFT_1061761 [Mycena floridula]